MYDTGIFASSDGIEGGESFHSVHASGGVLGG